MTLRAFAAFEAHGTGLKPPELCKIDPRIAI